MAKKTVTESEYEIMKILWESDAPITVGEVYKRLPEAEKRWSKNTVATLLVRLCEKGAAAYEKKGSCHLYYATLDRADYSVSETKSFVSRLFGGSVRNMVASLYDNSELTKQDIDELRELLKADKKND